MLQKAGERTRTVNLLLTRQLLYQLSYASESRGGLLCQTNRRRGADLDKRPPPNYGGGRLSIPENGMDDFVSGEGET